MPSSQYSITDFAVNLRILNLLIRNCRENNIDVRVIFRLNKIWLYDLIMLTNTFIHIQSIGAITEQRLWESGIRDWDSFSSDLPIPISPGRQHFLLKGIDGFFAVLLWDEYQKTGNQKTLDTLLSYNIQDTITLASLMVTAYNMKLKETPFYESLLTIDSPPPVNPYRVDLATVDKIKRSPQFWQSQQWY